MKTSHTNQMILSIGKVKYTPKRIPVVIIRNLKKPKSTTVYCRAAPSTLATRLNMIIPPLVEVGLRHLCLTGWYLCLLIVLYHVHWFRRQTWIFAKSAIAWEHRQLRPLGEGRFVAVEG